MKSRHFSAIFLALLMAVCLAATAFASDVQLSHVTDQAGLFTDTQREALEQRAEAISEEYDFGVYIVTLEDFQDYTNSSNIEKFADRFYDEYGLGYGDDHAGVMPMPAGRWSQP